MNRKPTLGETLFITDSGNRVRHNKDKKQIPRPVPVTKVGSKYFEVTENGQNIVFQIENWRQKSDYTADYSIWESREKYEEYKERQRLIVEIERSRCHNGISIESLRLIRDLLNVTPTK